MRIYIKLKIESFSQCGTPFRRFFLWKNFTSWKWNEFHKVDCLLQKNFFAVLVLYFFEAGLNINFIYELTALILIKHQKIFKSRWKAKRVFTWKLAYPLQLKKHKNTNLSRRMKTILYKFFLFYFYYRRGYNEKWWKLKDICKKFLYEAINIFY